MIEARKNLIDQGVKEQNKYYKGKYRYYALENMYHDKIMSAKEQAQQKTQTQRVKKARQLIYSDGIRELHR